MSYTTQKFVGGSVKSVIIAQDYELDLILAPSNPETLLEIVNTNNNIVTVKGYYYWNGASWQWIGSSVPSALQGAYDLNGNPTGIVNPKGGKDVPSVKQTIKSAIEVAQRVNAYTQQPLSPAPTWESNKVYQGAQIVRGLAAGSTANLYLCCGSTTVSSYVTTGTSAVAGGPSGIGPALITDNTCVWQYIGNATSTGSYPLYSTVIPAVASDVMNGYIAFVTSANLANLGLTTQYSVSNAASPTVTFANCALSDSVTLVPKNQGTLAVPSRPPSGLRSVARFNTNAKKWVAWGVTPQGASYPINIKGIKVNGQWLSESQLGKGVLANPVTYILDVSSFPSGNKLIELFFYDDPVNWSGGLSSAIAVGVEEYVYPFISSNNYKIAIEGDSIFDMTYLSSLMHIYRSEVVLGEMLGCNNVLNNCIGGTGLISNNSNNKTTFIQRLSDIVSFAPDLIIFAGGHNDNSYTSVARQAAMLLWLQTARASLPYATIVVVGTQLLQGDDITTAASTSMLTVEQDLLAAVNTFNDNNTTFIPILTATNKLITSVANGYFFNAGGSSPYNNSHPTTWYYYHVLKVIVEGIKKFYQTN